MKAMLIRLLKTFGPVLLAKYRARQFSKRRMR